MMRVRSRSSRRMLPTNRSAIAFARGARTGSLDHLDACAGEDGVERGGEFGVAVADEESEGRAGVIQVHGQVAGQLGQPGCGRVRGDSEDVDLAGGVFDDEERVEPGQSDGVDVEEVGGQDGVGLGAEELGPGGSGPPCRRGDAGCVQDLPDGGGADLVAESGEFAVDASVAPNRVLGGQAHRQYPQSGWDRWSAGSAIVGGPAAGDESSVPAQECGWGDEHACSAAVGESSDEDGDQCSVGPIHPGSRGAAVQYSELVAQYEDLDILGSVGAGT
jgi:hypothetical protein